MGADAPSAPAKRRAAPWVRQEHPDRPRPPAHMIPFKGNDNTAWLAWRNQCDVCEHKTRIYGCVRAGVLVYGDGTTRGFPTIPGGCADWRPKK